MSESHFNAEQDDPRKLLRNKMGCIDRSFVNTSDRNKWRYLNTVSGGGINATRIASLVREGADGFSSQSDWSAWIYCPDAQFPAGGARYARSPVMEG